MDWRSSVVESNLSSSARLVGLVLTTFMNRNGLCFPSKDTIAAGCDFSRRTVDKAVNELESAGYLEVSHSRGRSSNRYRALTRQQIPGSSYSNPVACDAQTGRSDAPTRHPMPGKAWKATERFSTEKKQHSTPDFTYLNGSGPTT